jgi:hypothetical protein
LRLNRTTGLDKIRFDELVEMVEARVEWDSPTGRPKALTLEQAVKATLIYFKNNVTEEVIAELMFVDQSTVSRAIADIEIAIADALDDWVPDLDEAVRGTATVVDGSLLPCWSWASHPELFSGKHHTTGHNHQFVVTLDGRLAHVTDPLPGSVHDTKAVRESGILDVLDPTNVFGDKGYVGTGVITPFKKPIGGELVDWQRKFNTDINARRYVVERAIANFKVWRVLFTDYRRPLSTYKTAFTAVRALYFYSTSSA